MDHFSASVDEFHEREVPRSKVFRVLAEILDGGTDVSIHLVGRDADDPYLEKMVGEVNKFFHGNVPMLVNTISAVGRAAAWLRSSSANTGSLDADPCEMAAWPVVGFDGTIIACGNDRVFETLPYHLRLGHAHSDDWQTIRSICINSSMLRAIRLFGPQYVVHRYRGGGSSCGDYCQNCMNVLPDQKIAEDVAELVARPSTAVLESEVRAIQAELGAVGFAKRHGPSRYANLVALGAQK